jgi:hypothetical protein
MGNLMVADVTSQVMLSLFTDFENMSAFRPDPRHEAKLRSMLDEVIAWAGALRSLRPESRAEASQPDARPSFEQSTRWQASML